MPIPAPSGGSIAPAGELGAAIRETLPYLRAQAESAFGCTFRAYAPDGTTVDGDGFKHPSYAEQGDVPGKIQSSSRGGNDTQHRMVRVGDVDRPVLEGGLHIPVMAPLPTAGLYGIGWEYECISVDDDVADPHLLGRRFLVFEVPIKTYATARRLNVVEL